VVGKEEEAEINEDLTKNIFSNPGMPHKIRKPSIGKERWNARPLQIGWILGDRSMQVQTTWGI
jgi:hypothetical protein